MQKRTTKILMKSSQLEKILLQLLLKSSRNLALIWSMQRPHKKRSILLRRMLRKRDLLQKRKLLKRKKSRKDLKLLIKRLKKRE